MEPASVTIVAKCFGDLRFEKLARLLGLPSGDDARTKCARLWRWQRDNFSSSRPTYVLDADTIDDAIGIVGAHEALVRSELAEVVDGGYRIKGSRGRIEQVWTARSAKGRKAPAPSCDGSGDRSRDRSPDTSGDRKPPTYMDPDLGSDLLWEKRDQISDLQIQSDLPGDHIHVPGRKSGDGSGDFEKLKRKVDERSAEARAAKIARIPERAFRAADYLRKLILDENPSNALRTKDWSDAAPQRIKWADEIRVLIERDKRSYEELADILAWLFHKQPSGSHRFVVQSVDALRSKWDRIQTFRRNRDAQPESPIDVAMRIAGGAPE